MLGDVGGSTKRPTLPQHALSRNFLLGELGDRLWKLNVGLWDLGFGGEEEDEVNPQRSSQEGFFEQRCVYSFPALWA